MDRLLVSFSKDADVRRIFIDEITTIENWEIALKRMADRGKLKNVLVVTAGSKATDLRRGAEKLPGRKGKLARTNYIFTPISFEEFKRVCGKKVKTNILLTYLLSGGSPVACTELATRGRLPEYVIEFNTRLDRWRASHFGTFAKFVIQCDECIISNGNHTHWPIKVSSRVWVGQ